MKPSYTKILEEYHSLSEKLSHATPEEIAKFGKQQSDLFPVVEKIQELEKHEKELEENKILAEGKDELAEIAQEEIRVISKRVATLEEEIETLLIPSDPLDEKNIIIEIRAGAGGDESALFAAELFRMYAKYAEKQKWQTSIISASRNDIGGYKEVVFEMKGKKVYSKMKFESGVHRVQRVPETEKAGRVHTSTVTVAVLPEFDQTDIDIPMKDLEMTANTASGHGGQSVNTTYSAIKIVHLPTGITAQSQDERSQAQNREKALAVIRSRVAAFYQEQREKEYKDKRKAQIGSGDRSEKIRTYNFPQDRLTDHRINQNFNQIYTILEGNLDLIINALLEEDLKLKKAAI
ncbi:MAG: Peptide chain release factor 1 [Candidatus Doudnabacteria bacterium]|nr:Peptide chain release factor 1 [Candidatus Doudnabacteria bacterium]